MLWVIASRPIYERHRSGATIMQFQMATAG